MAGYMNQGNWGALLQGGVQGAETEQKMQNQDYLNQEARARAGQAGRENMAGTENFNAAGQKINSQGGLNNGDPNNPAMVGQYQQSGGVFDPARNAIHSALANIGRFYQGVFHGGAQGQTNPQAAPSGRGPGPAAQQTLPGPGQAGSQAPAAMSRPQATSSGGTAGPPGATGPMPLPEQPTTTGSQYAEGGAIPGRSLRGIRAKKGKPGNVAKATAGDKQVANQQPGAGGPQMALQQNMPPRNTEPGAGISNQDPQLSADGNFIQKAIKKPGQLHKDLGVPEGEKIPKSKIKAAEKGGGKTAKRAQLADTMSKFKDGGKVPFPKLEPGAAPEPKPAPNAVEQTVNENGMRHYLGKTIKRYAGGGDVNKDVPVPTPAGAQPADSQALGDPREPSLFDRAVTGIKNFAADPSDKSLAERAGLSGGTNPPPPGMQGPSAQPVPESPPSPVAQRGASPPQQNAAPGAPKAAAKPNYTPATPGQQQQPPPDAASAEAWNEKVSGFDKQGNPVNPDTVSIGDQTFPNGPHGAVGVTRTAGGPTPPQFSEQGPPNPNQSAPVDFSQVKADQSQVPTMSTQDWQQMKNGIVRVATAHGAAGGQAEMMADEEVSKYQHGNFMQYMQQAAALDAAGNKQGAMTSLKTAYQFFPTGHDMHFGLAANGDIIGYGVNEKTGEPVQNGAIHLNQQALHGIMTHFQNPENFVSEGVRMQMLADEHAHVTQGQIPLERAQATRAYGQNEYLQNRNATSLAVAETRANAAGRAHMQPDIQKFYSSNLKDLPNAGDAEDVAGQLEAKAPGGVDQAHRTQILGIVRHLFDPSTDPGEREQFMKKYGLTAPGQENDVTAGAIPGRGEDPYARSYALYGQ
jgi:hypothetical protein